MRLEKPVWEYAQDGTGPVWEVFDDEEAKLEKEDH